MVETDPPQHPPSEWHKDNRVLMIAMTLVAQLFAGAWWAASIASTVSALEHRMIAVEQMTSGPGSVLVQISTRTARIEGQLGEISDQIRAMNGPGVASPVRRYP